MLNLDKKEKEYLLALLAGAPESATGKKLAARIARSLRPIQVKSAKRKGMDWQKECCEMIGRITGVPYPAEGGNGEIRSRESARPGTDIILRGTAAERFDWQVECKNTRTVSLPEWIRQAQRNSGEADNWLLLIKSEALPCRKIAVMDLNRFEALASQTAGRQNGY